MLNWDVQTSVGRRVSAVSLHYFVCLPSVLPFSHSLLGIHVVCPLTDVIAGLALGPQAGGLLFGTSPKNMSEVRVTWITHLHACYTRQPRCQKIHVCMHACNIHVTSRNSMQGGSRDQQVCVRRSGSRQRIAHEWVLQCPLPKWRPELKILATYIDAHILLYIKFTNSLPRVGTWHKLLLAYVSVTWCIDFRKFPPSP